jgi:ABC-type Fe3+/spermidine/putrescine transport system ATPase subunit
MNYGSVQQVTTPKELYETPTNRFVADFVGEVNFLSGTVRAVEGDLCTVELEGGLVVRASAPDRCERDQSVALAVRPERISLGPSGATNALEALVEDHIYLGESMKYRVRLANGEQITVKVPGRQVAAFAAGSKTTVGWAPADARLLQQ